MMELRKRKDCEGTEWARDWERDMMGRETDGWGSEKKG
jgi:hypothetical protein